MGDIYFVEWWPVTFLVLIEQSETDFIFFVTSHQYDWVDSTDAQSVGNDILSSGCD